MKTLRRAFIYISLTIGVLLISLVVSVFLFKDKIINEFISEANKQLNTPVKIAKFEVSMLDDFPNLSIVLKDVYVEDSHEGIYPLLTAREIAFTMNPIEAYNGNYTIKGLSIHDSETNLKIDSNGKNNYTIAKPAKDSSQGSLKFELKDVDLSGTRVHYTDLRNSQDFVFVSENLKASIQSSDDIYNIEAVGHVLTEKIQIDSYSYLAGKSFTVTSKLVYDDINKVLTINPSTLNLKQAQFDVSGSYAWKEKNTIDLATSGRNTDIQTLLSLMPEKISSRFEKYKSDGDVYFKAKLKGEISKRKHPSLSIDFGFHNATIFHPEYKTRIEDASLEGSFASSDISDQRFSALILKNITGKLNDQAFTSSFTLHNFNDPEVMCNFKGKIEAPAILSFYPVEDLKDVTGSMLADVAFEGKLGLLKNKTTAQRVSTQGNIELEDINFLYGKDKTEIQHLNGSLQFNNNDLALSNVSGKLADSDFLLNGFFKNIITFLIFDNQPIGIEADLKSKYINLNQVFSFVFGQDQPTSSKSVEAYQFSISPNVNLNFNCDIGALEYRRFHAQRVKGDLLVKNEVAVSRNLSFHSMGGDVVLSGIVDAKNHKAIDVLSSFKLNGIHLDSAFYVFENFNQDFIEDRHLKGQAYADVNLEMAFNQNLKLFQETLIADIGVTIKNGELNNFEPMKKLSKYLDDQGLSKLKFSDLKNDIHIENKTIYIPQMEVRSNVTNLKVSGTHTFDQHIDYRIITPLRRKRPLDMEEQNAVEEDESGESRLFLKITGTTENYKVAYDTESVRKKIASDLKKEVQELKDAFKNKGKKKQKELELEKDEYFDWDDQH